MSNHYFTMLAPDYRYSIFKQGTWKFPCTLKLFLNGKKKTNWQRLPELLINLPIIFKIGKINKFRVVSCQEKAASYMLLTKNERLGLLFTIFDAFLAQNTF